MMDWQHVRFLPDDFPTMARRMMTNHPLQTSIAAFAVLLASVLIMRALWLHFGKTFSASPNRTHNSRPSVMTPAQKPANKRPIENPSHSENPPLDLTLQNPDAGSDVARLYDFTPGDVSPETNAPMDPMRVGSEFFFLKERIATIENKLQIRRPQNGRFGFGGG